MKHQARLLQTEFQCAALKVLLVSCPVVALPVHEGCPVAGLQHSERRLSHLGYRTGLNVLTVKGFFVCLFVFLAANICRT